MTAADHYLELRRELLALRGRAGFDERAEDSILERMDEAWFRLTQEERDRIDPKRRPWWRRLFGRKDGRP